MPSSPPARAPLPQQTANRVDAILRRSQTFPNGKLWVVPTRQQTPAGPIRVAQANKNRIEVWIRALRSNGPNLVFIGAQDVSGVVPLITGGGTGVVGGDGWELEAGDVLVISTTMGDIWAVAQDSAANPVMLRVLELIDQGPLL